LPLLERLHAVGCERDTAETRYGEDTRPALRSGLQ
jgi:hypothetical protein